MREELSVRFSKRLRQLRQREGWTQEVAAEHCGVGYKLFQLYELGVKKNPGLHTLQKIAAGFGVEAWELLAPSLPRRKVIKVGEALQKKR